MKNKSNKLSQLERNRYSIFTDNLDNCYFCGNKRNDLHEIFGGCRRKLSMEYGLVLPLCRRCHTLIESNEKYKYKWKIKGKVKFMEHYEKSEEEFIKKFSKNYYEKYE